MGARCILQAGGVLREHKPCPRRRDGPKAIPPLPAWAPRQWSAQPQPFQPACRLVLPMPGLKVLLGSRRR